MSAMASVISNCIVFGFVIFLTQLFIVTFYQKNGMTDDEKKSL